MRATSRLVVLIFVLPAFLLADYDEWTHFNFLQPSSPEESAWSADPDNDGGSNLLEYALGGNPVVSDHLAISHSFVDGRLTLSAVRPKDRPDLFYYFQFADSPSGPWSGGGAVNLLPPVDLGSFVKVAGQDAAPIIGSRRFARMGVVFRDLDGNGNGVFDAWEAGTYGMLGIPGLGDKDSDGVPDREDAAVFDPAFGRLMITITSPENGSANP